MQLIQIYQRESEKNLSNIIDITLNTLKVDNTLKETIKADIIKSQHDQFNTLIKNLKIKRELHQSDQKESVALSTASELMKANQRIAHLESLLSLKNQKSYTENFPLSNPLNMKSQPWLNQMQ